MSNSTPTAKTARRSCAGCATVLVAVTVFLGFRFHRMLEPADRVFVSLRNIDASTDYFFFVADTPSGPEEMP